MISKIVLERALEMIPISSDDATRYHMCGVYVEAVKEVVTLAATDGHMLLTKDIPAKCPAGKFLIHRDEVAALKLVLKECKYMEEIECTVTPEGGLLLGLNIKAKISKATNYPDYKTVIPKEKGSVTIGLNAEYLLALAKGLHEGGKMRNVSLTFNPEKPCDPLFVGLGTGTAVLMPVRV